MNIEYVCKTVVKLQHFAMEMAHNPKTQNLDRISMIFLYILIHWLYIVGRQQKNDSQTPLSKVVMFSKPARQRIYLLFPKPYAINAQRKWKRWVIRFNVALVASCLKQQLSHIHIGNLVVGISIIWYIGLTETFYDNNLFRDVQ